MRYFADKIVYDKYEPENTNVIWVQPTEEGAQIKAYIDGEWQLIGYDHDAYRKPASGIPESDLEESVRNAIDNAQLLDGKIDAEQARAESAEGGLDERLGIVEQLADISIGGGDATIATASDFNNPTATQKAYIPTVGAILDSADTTPTSGSGKLVTSGGVYNVINSLKSAGYVFAGVATPSSTISTPTEKVFYIGGAGTYANFGASVTVPVGSICVFKYNGSWAKEQIDIAVELKSQVDGLDAQINGGTEDEVDYTQTVTISGSSSGYFDLRDLSAFVDGNTYKITIVAGENASIRIQTRNSSNTTVQNIAEYFSVISGNTYTFQWTKQSSEVRIFSTSMTGNSYKGVFTISHPIPTQGLAEKVEYMEPIVEDNNEKINGGDKIVTGYELFVSSSYIKTDGTSVSGSGWKRTDFIPLDVFIGCKVWLHPSVASVAFYSDQDISSFLGYAGSGTYGTEGTFFKSDLTIPAGTNYVIISTENNAPNYPYTASSVTVIEHILGFDERITELENNISQKGWAHISFDDVVYCLNDITVNANSYTSIFDNDFFATLKNLHETFGAVFSLFVFLEDATTGQYATNWTLANTTTKFKNEFMSNASWLKFGLHARNKNTNYSSGTAAQATEDYNSFVSSVIAFAGSVESIDRLPRLGNFAGTLENVLALRDCDAGIIGALSAYDDRVSYYLTETESELAYKNGVLIDTTNHLAFYTSLYAIEAQDPIATWATRLIPATMGRFYNLEWMMHEYALGGQDYGYSAYVWSSMVEKLTAVCTYSKGYKWGYPQDAALNAGL